VFPEVFIRSKPDTLRDFLYIQFDFCAEQSWRYRGHAESALSHSSYDFRAPNSWHVNPHQVRINKATEVGSKLKSHNDVGQLWLSNAPTLSIG
jgi:hypothetical protein